MCGNERVFQTESQIYCLFEGDWRLTFPSSRKTSRLTHRVIRPVTTVQIITKWKHLFEKPNSLLKCHATIFEKYSEAHQKQKGTAVFKFPLHSQPAWPLTWLPIRSSGPGFPNLVPRPAASVAPQNWLKMHTLRPHSRPTEARTLGMEPSNVSNRLSGWFWCTLESEKHRKSLLPSGYY